MSTLMIVGATGLVGNLVLELALADKRVSRIIALTRRPLSMTSGGKLENIVIDFINMPDQADWWSVDGVISALGTTRAASNARSVYRQVDYDYPLAVARHTRAHGATSFALTSSLGANPHSLFAYTRTKGELEIELQKLEFPSLTIVRPSVLDGHRVQQRFDERMTANIFNMLAPIIPRRLRISPASAVAATLVDSAVEAASGIHIKHNEEMCCA